MLRPATRASALEEERPPTTTLVYLDSPVKARPVLANKPVAPDRKAILSETETPGMGRIVEYSQRDIIPIRTRLRYTTVISLPAEEQIMDFVVGDKENWVINGAANLAYIKPAKASAATNLNLVSARGIVYSFLLAEVGDGVPDLKIFIQTHDEAIQLALKSPAKYIPVERVEDYRQQADAAKAQAREAQQAARQSVESQVSAFKSTYPASLQFDYRFERDKKPFEVTEIFTDGKFTYIKAHPEETPTLYEVKDGSPNLVNFEFRDGIYVVGKVLDSGYLVVGKKRFVFSRERKQ